MAYPNSIWSPSAIVNGVTKLVAALFNSPNTETIAIETELGTNPKGLHADVKTRLNGYDSGWVSYTTAPVTLSHNLGTTKFIASIYYATQSNGSDATLGGGNLAYYSSGGMFSTLTNITTTQVTIRVGAAGYDNAGPVWNGSSWVYDCSYARIIMLALE